MKASSSIWVHILLFLPNYLFIYGGVGTDGGCVVVMVVVMVVMLVVW